MGLRLIREHTTYYTTTTSDAYMTTGEESLSVTVMRQLHGKAYIRDAL